MKACVRYSPKIAAAICEAVSEGKTLREICAEEGMPARRSIHNWIMNHPDFRERYQEARSLWADHVFEEIYQLADEARRLADEADKAGRNANAAVGAIREEIRAKQWIAARLRPQAYGDRLEHVGADGKDLIQNSATDPARLAAALMAIFKTVKPPAPPLLDAIPDAEPQRVFDIATGRPIWRLRGNGDDR